MTNVRSAMVAMLALALLALGSLAAVAPPPAPAASAADEPRITLAMLPSGTTVEEIAAALPDAAPGVLSAGLGPIPASQTYLDIGQGSRLGGTLYDSSVPPLYVLGNRVPGRRWREVLERAEEAPADVRPGLLATTLLEAGVLIAAQPLAGSPALIAVDEGGRVRRTSQCEAGGCPGVSVTPASVTELPQLRDGLRPGGDDLLIALERAPADRDLVAIAIAGEGYSGSGNLTSATTRMDGYVLATDLLPTILGHYGIEVPDGVDGREIEAEGEADAVAVADREQRLSDVSDHRWSVLAVNLLAWVGCVGAAAAIGGRPAVRVGLVLLATTMALVPALLLIGAALQPSELGERLLVGLGGPAVATLALLGLRRPFGERAPYGAFAVAAGVSVGSTAIDVVAGSPLTSLSLLGPNPALGVRFFGIGNELEATLAALLLLGAGAAVTAWQPRDPRRAVAIVGVVGVVCAVGVFAPGRLGADVGAAITFPAGAAALVVAALQLGRRRALLVVAAPFLALVALLAVDLVLGGDAHLSRSVLAAGGLDELGDVFERRILSGARSFPRYLDSPFFIAAIAAIAAAIAFRARISTWFSGRPAASAGVIGAMAATVVGTLANDSAALLLMVGTGFIAAFCGIAWAAAGGGDDTASR